MVQSKAIADTPSSDGTLSPVNFIAASHAFVKKWKIASHDLPPWSWVSCKTTPLASSHQVDGYLALEKMCLFKSVKVNNGEVVDNELGEPICFIDGDSEDDDATLAEAADQSGGCELHYSDFHIVYSSSYRVLVLYFRGYRSDGLLLVLDEIEKDLLDSSFKVLTESKWTFITQMLQSSEDTVEMLRERCFKFYNGCHKYTGDGTLRKAPDMWRKWNVGMGNGMHNMQLHISMRVGGRMVYSTCSMIPVENEVVVAEILRRCKDSVELVDVSMELPELVRRPGLKKWKEARKRFDNASITYEQARERFLSLKKNSRRDIAIIIEEELNSARSIYEETRFNLITVISNVEAKKRSEFLEGVSRMIASHLHYFKQVTFI